MARVPEFATLTLLTEEYRFMPNPDISILIVDDAKFSNIMIHRLLKSAGYTDIRQASTSQEALRLIEQRPAQILLADWLMPEMDGLALTQAVRQIDEASNHFTYIILLTAREGQDVLLNAFEQGVDDFINKALMSGQLLARLAAAERTSSMQNRLLHDYQSILDVNNKLKELSSIDPLTGLGNRTQAQRRLDETIRHCNARGGACCYLLISLNNMDQLKKNHDSKAMGQLLIGIARRLRQLVRPLDEVARIAPNQIAIINIQQTVQSCTPETFQRILDGVNLKAYKTSTGFISVKASMSMVVYVCSEETPSAETLMQRAQSRMEQAQKSGAIAHDIWKPLH